jgi:hypothetical protein
MGSMITEFQGGRRVRNHSVPEAKCSMLFCRQETILKFLPRGSEKMHSGCQSSFRPCKTFVNEFALSLKHAFYI